MDPAPDSAAPEPREAWRRFFFGQIAAFLAISLGLYAFLVVTDPFDSLSLSPDLDRAPIDENQRYTYPALARNPRFDSAVIGTSTSRLLDPACLDGEFGAAFVNLAMNGSEAWEQAQILRLFLRHHPEPRVVIMGLDRRWMIHDEDPPTRSAHYRFPDWLYDEDPVNDYLHLFDRWTLERARRQGLQVLGLREPKYGRNGYRNFTRDFGAYDPEKVRRTLYAKGRAALEPVEPPVVLDDAERRALRFPTQELLAELIARIPAETEKVFFFPPYHHTRLGPPGGRGDAIRAEAKARIARLVASTPRARLLDFMLRNELTREDANYWDHVHVTEAVAQAMCEALRASRDPESPAIHHVLLVPFTPGG